MLEKSIIAISLMLVLIAIVIMIKVKPSKDKKNDISNLITLAIMLLCSIIAYVYQLSNIAGGFTVLSITSVLFIIFCIPKKEGK